MKIGISSASLYPMETEKALEFLCRNEIPVTEIFFNSPSELEPSFVRGLSSVAKTYGVEVASVHPCGSVGEPYFLFSEYERRYKESRDWYKKYYQAAGMLGAKYVVLHGDSLMGHISDEQYCQRLLEMNEMSAEFGVCVVHENVNKFRCATPSNIEKFKNMTDGELKFTFDVKQSIRAGFTPEEVYKAMGENIVHVHISDNNARCDCMLPGKGDYDFGGLFRKLEGNRYNGACLIEVYSYTYNDASQLLEAYKFVTKSHKFC